MPTRAAILTAVAGKAVERGLDPSIEGDFAILRYPREMTEREDNLHKQSIRSLVKRIAPDWKIHILTMDQDGFSVEVRPAPKAQEAVPEIHEAVEPGPAVAGKEIDLNDVERMKQLITEMMGIAEKLGAVAAGIAGVSLLT